MSPRHNRGGATPLLVLALLLIPSHAALAEAQQWSRHHAASCRPAYPAELQRHAVGGPGVANYPSGFHTVKCELPDTSAGPDSAITRIRVYVRDAVSWDFFEVRACTISREDGSTECGPALQTGESYTGDTELTLEAAELAPLQGSNFGFLLVYIPNRSDTLGWSYLKGFIVER